MAAILLKSTFDAELGCLVFVREAEELPVYAMVQMMDSVPAMQAAVQAAAALESQQAKVASAKSQRTR